MCCTTQGLSIGRVKKLHIDFTDNQKISVGQIPYIRIVKKQFLNLHVLESEIFRIEMIIDHLKK